MTQIILASEENMDTDAEIHFPREKEAKTFSEKIFRLRNNFSFRNCLFKVYNKTRPKVWKFLNDRHSSFLAGVLFFLQTKQMHANDRQRSTVFNF